MMRLRLHVSRTRALDALLIRNAHAFRPGRHRTCYSHCDIYDTAPASSSRCRFTLFAVHRPARRRITSTQVKQPGGLDARRVVFSCFARSASMRSSQSSSPRCHLRARTLLLLEEALGCDCDCHAEHRRVSASDCAIRDTDTAHAFPRWVCGSSEKSGAIGSRAARVGEQFHGGILLGQLPSR